MNAKRPRPGGTEGVAGTVVVPINPTPVSTADPPPAVSIRDKLLWDLADIAALTGLSRRLLEKGDLDRTVVLIHESKLS